MAGSRYQDNNQRDRRGKKKKGSAVGRFFSTVLLLIALGVFCYAAYELYGYYREYKAGTDEYGHLNDQYVNILPPEQEAEASTDGESPEGPVLTSVEELEDPDTLEQKVEAAGKTEAVENGEEKVLPMLRNPINFTELNAINEDIIGWIRIKALDLSYPVAQGEDNDYYLHRTFEREDNFAGCIFLNCDNSKFFTDQNSIVYGHNMKNGSMFGTLKKFKDQEVYDDCAYFWIFTPDFIYQYRIFSCSEVSKIGDPYRTRFLTKDFREFLDTCLENSVVDNGGMEVSTDDRIVTLSTCTGNEATRFIVQGKLMQIYVAR